MKLNGWLRLWVFVSVVMLTLAAILYYFLYQPLVGPVETIDIEVKDTKQRLTIPKKMDESEINKFVAEYQSKEKDEIKKEAQLKLLVESYHIMNQNDEIKAKNEKLIIYIGVIWVFTVVSILLLGIGVFWVRNGFKSK